MALAKLIELDIPWMHLPNDQLPYTSIEFMLGAAVVYLVIIGVGSALLAGKVLHMPWALLIL